MSRIAPALAVCVLGVAATASAKELSVDTTDFIVLSDGHDHFVAFPQNEKPHFSYPEAAYYGSAKTLYEMHVIGGSSDSTRRMFTLDFKDQRMRRALGGFVYNEGKYEILCDDHKVTLEPVPKDRAAKLLSGARFERSPHEWMAFALGRDDRGTYYYVDRGRFSENERAFRVFIGPKGSLEKQKLVNVVNDSEGSIFATPDGSLRLIVSSGEYFWVHDSDRQPLVKVPVDKNLRMIYTELGVYAAERLGTPCDDM